MATPKEPRPNAADGATANRSDVVCWTRMQAEAGQPIEAIVDRKELERVAGNGLFCWGIGNAPPRSLLDFVKQGADIDVIFSIMKTRPKLVDVAPFKIVVWRKYLDFEGIERALPPNTLITSRAKEGGRAHYALMCRTEDQLALSDKGAFDPAAYLNVSEAAKPVGASQVTALLRRVAPEVGPTSYRVNLRASLAKSFWVKLCSPLELSSRAQHELVETLRAVRRTSPTDWLKLALGVRGELRRKRHSPPNQLVLL